MMIINHGKWMLYKPEKHYWRFEEAGAQGMNILYAKRESDGKDWYVYVNDDEPFKDGSVRMIIHDQGDGWIVGAATYDATALWPAGALVLEITDYRGSDPQTDFGGKMFDLGTRELRERPPLVPTLTPTEEKILGTLDAVMARLEKLEGK
jgi:hypothetical protein